MPLTERQDLWVRARKNALANDSASKRYRRMDIAISGLESALLTAAIACTAVGFFLATWTTGTAASQGAWLFGLGLAAVLLNAAALLAHMIAEKLGWDALAKAHGHLGQSYGMIAQRLRDNDEMSLEMARELLVINKSQGPEPTDSHFARADALLPQMRPYPLGLTEQQIMECVRLVSPR